jgi:DNA-directed RNA polymerase specialized sigma24 family protein
MIFHDRNRVKALRGLPTLQRILFDLYAFDNIDPAEMARGLGADIASITLCLAEARGMIVAWRLHRPRCRFDPATIGRPVAQLEHAMRRQYRQWLEATMIASGYDGAIQWPALSADDDAEREAVAVLILSGLPAKVRRAVARSGARGIAAMVWRYVPPWRTVMRHHLDRLAREVRHSGWLPFDVWLANRIAPDHYYPDGLPVPRVIRQPLGHEEAAVDQAERDGAHLPEPIAMQERFDRLPALTREVYVLLRRYGRTADEIAERLGIARWSAKRRIRIALFVVITGSPPPIWHTLSFEFELQWRRWRDRVHLAWKALRGD